MRMVESAEEFGADLQPVGFEQFEGLERREIPSGGAGPIERNHTRGRPYSKVFM